MAGRSSFGQVRKLPSGRYRARYTVPGRPQTWVNAPTTFARKGDAEDWLAHRRADIVDGVVRPQTLVSRETLRTYAPRWLDERRNSRGEPLRPSTRRTYQQYLDAYLYKAFGDTPLPKIERDDVKAWFRDFAPGKPTLRARVFAFLRGVLATAVDDDLIAENPARIRGAGQVRPATAKVIATPQQVDELGAAMPDRLALAIQLGAWCQLRNGETLALRRRDITKDLVSVTRGITWVKGKPVFGPPKTAAGVRTVAVPPHLAVAVAAHLLDHTAGSDDALLFPAHPGEAVPIHQNTFAYYMARAVEKTSLPKGFRFHWLRHTGLTWAAQMGATVGELQARAGHSTPNVALLYQHATAERDAALAKSLSRLAPKGSTTPAR